MRTIITEWSVTLGVVGALLVGAGCRVDVNTRVEVAASPALWSAAIAGTAVTLETHDEHAHHASCGHYRRWHEDRWVYFYEDRWEYFDTDSGVWYAYLGPEGATANTQL